MFQCSGMKIDISLGVTVRGAKTPISGEGLVNIGLTKNTHEQIVLIFQRSTIVILCIIAEKRIEKVRPSLANSCRGLPFPVLFT